MKNRLALTVTFVFLLSSVALAQGDGSLPASLSAPQDSVGNGDAGQSLGDMARHVRKDHSEETRLTPEDAKKLFTAVDRISAFASEDSCMPLRAPVKRRIISPDDVEKSARERVSKKDFSDRFERSELTMKKFGFIPRDFDLKEFMIKVGRKEIAGYYDDETKTISLLNTIPLEQQEAVLAHELTHALQDQNYNLHTWMKVGEEQGKDPADLTSDESSSARRAVVEGQAMVVFGDYVLAPSGRTLLNSPGLIYRMEDPGIKAVNDSEMLHEAPIVVRTAGTFPYHDGLIFEGELLQAGGKKLAFAGVFAHPPRNTHEILQPRAYLQRENLPGLPFPDAKALLGSDYELFDSGSIGELDVQSLLWQMGTRTLADDLSKNWQGGAYMAFRRKGVSSATTADLKVLYVSRWSSEIAAQRFAKFYLNSVPRRYRSAQGESAGACSGSNCPKAASVVETEEGPVIVELWADNTVVVSEGFDRETASKLSTATRTPGHKTIANTSLEQELGMRLYGLPAFRRFQEYLRRQIAFEIAAQMR